MFELGWCGGDDDLVAGAAGMDAPARGGADGGEFRATGEHDVFGVDGSVRGVHADDPAADWCAAR